MPHHGNEAEHSEGNEPRKPVIRDNRKVDPETGAARHPEGDAAAPTEGNAAPTDGDALSQAEEILNGVEVPAEESVASGAAAEAQAAELRNDLLRLQAEYVNYRKRVERDRAVAGEMAVIGVLNSLLPVLDDVDAARQHGDLEDGPFAAIATKLESALKTYGLERIAETGVEFDPTIHEALIQQPGEDIQVDTVSQVLRSGYRSGERVLRAAQVIVAVPA
ncbi:nucleotide exchange factor GrpE [Paenarthrobacter nitroguajacolicus]|uniref:nucleotide exchange factor GrpE n=1 Tax=Paenarthrobacter nitroguajacolicus TaxID=211146 RepID=UPI00248C0823|nr:nucleotide exchange factor GrpE [Paenarthrobacter nitroguajacolicus]MDI2033559.1 Protein GrpE [Paenarthrobacter nitroguajacolicus]